MITIDFEKEYNGLKYKDALVLTEEQFNAMTEQDIENLKQERFDNWVSIITAPPINPDPPPEED